MNLKKFNHVGLRADVPFLERVEGNGTRLYKTPNGELYPSVTTVLSILPKPELDAWVAAVGQKEADEVSSRAANRGTLVHEAAEEYLNNIFPSNINPMVMLDFMPIKKVLDEKVDNVVQTEIRLWSDKLKAAGTGDLFADFEGELSYIDFKTSSRIKYESDIELYFIQESVYAYMMYERYGVEVKNIITIMMVDGDKNALVFKKRPSKKYIKKFIEARELFKNEKGI